MPCLRSHLASSNPFDGPGGAFSSPMSLSRAPCGGDRPSGSSSRTGSCTRRFPQRSTSAFVRWSNVPSRGGSSTSTTAHSAVPIRDASTLRSSWASRTPPQPHATTTTAEPSAATRRRVSEVARPTEANATAAPSVGTTAGRAKLASAKPRQRAPTNACGRRSVTSRDNQTLQLRHVRGPYAGHAVELGDRVERPVRLPEVENLLRRHGADPRQALELLERGRVQVQRSRRRGARRGRARGDGTGRAPSGNDDLLTVGDRCGEVDGVELCLGGRPAG